MHSPTVPLAYGQLLMWIGLSAVALVMIGFVLRRRGRRSWATTFLAVFVWSPVVIALVTLLPDDGCRGAGCPPPGYATHPCSWVLPSGLGLLEGAFGARDLNAVLFVPSGVLVGLVALRGRQARLLVPLGLVVLVAYSALMELVQRQVGRLGRACDLADVVDNSSGAVVGVALGLVLAVGLTWLRRHRAPALELETVGGRPLSRQ